MDIVIVLPDKVIAPAPLWRLKHPDTCVGVTDGVRVNVGVFVIVGVRVTVGVSVGEGVRVGVGENMGVFVGVSVGVLDGVKVGVFAVGVAVGVDGRKVEGGTVTTMATLTKMVRALFALIGFGGVVSCERITKGINLGMIGK